MTTYKCNKCNNDLYIAYDDEYCDIHDFFFTSDYEDMHLHYCPVCKLSFIMCCNTPTILSDVCKYTIDGYITVDNTNIYHHLGYDDDDDDSDDENCHVNIEALNIDCLGNKNILTNGEIWITGPNGGFGFSMKCKVCNAIYELNDK